MPSNPLAKYSALPRPNACSSSAGSDATVSIASAIIAPARLTPDSSASESSPTEPVSHQAMVLRRIVATAVAIALGTAITVFTYYLVFVKPRSVDFLVATEGEMKKVNWSTRREVVGSTTAVVVTAAVLALFCWGLEIIFVWFFQMINVLKS